MNPLPKVHFVEKYLLNPTNPVTVNLIGAGGTGSAMLPKLARLDKAQRALGHPGLFVRLFDGDTVSATNTCRQLFTDSEVGLNKAVCLINRANLSRGTNWKAYPFHYNEHNILRLVDGGAANIFISCVDKVAARFEIADIIKGMTFGCETEPYRPFYWLDCGNSKHTGQVVLSTVSAVKQPDSKRYCPVGKLPMITDEFGDLLRQSELQDDTPSCSVEEALAQQDLFINDEMANKAGQLIWNMFRQGMLEYRGCFVNLKNFKSEALPVG